MKVMITNNELILIVLCILIGLVIIIFFIALILDSRRDYRREMEARYNEFYDEQMRKKANARPAYRPHEAYLIDDKERKARKLPTAKGHRPLVDGEQILVETHYRDRNGQEQIKRIKK